MLTGCASSSGRNTATPVVAVVPAEYEAGCGQYEPQLAVDAPSKVNASRIAAAFGNCAALQADTVFWAKCYLADLAGLKPTAACSAAIGQGGATR